MKKLLEAIRRNGEELRRRSEENYRQHLIKAKITPAKPVPDITPAAI